MRAKPEAIACCNDLVALGAYDVLREAGLRIPQDMSIAGHNDMAPIRRDLSVVYEEWLSWSWNWTHRPVRLRSRLTFRDA